MANEDTKYPTAVIIVVDIFTEIICIIISPKLDIISVMYPHPIFPSRNDSEQELEKSGCEVEDLRSSANRRSYDASLILKWEGWDINCFLKRKLSGKNLRIKVSNN